MTIRRLRALACAFLIVLCFSAARAHAQNQAFTYQGRIDNGGTPAPGPVNLIVKLFNVDTNGTPIGTQTINGVPLIGGVFTVTLNTGGEFSANPFADGGDRWVEITVNGTTLSPRQKLSVAPMAAFSAAPWILTGTTLSYSAGNVAIGNTFADRPLTLNEASTAAGANRASQLMSFQTDYATRWHTNLLSPDGASSTNYGLNFAETGVSDYRLFLAKGGNVGIGTAAPSGRLEIASSGDALVIRPPTMIGTNFARLIFKDPDGGTPPTALTYRDNGYPNLSVNSTIGVPARLGVNTTEPQQALDVRGEVAFGLNGQYSPAASGSGNIRVLQAVVNSSNGSLFSGSGLTVVRNSAGHYTVTFTNAFTNYPSVVVTPISPGSPALCSTNLLNTGSVLVDIFNSAGAGVDLHFSIIAIGAR